MRDTSYLQAEQKSERNYGIDALRLFSMFLVVVLHVLGQGGVLDSATGMNEDVAWLLEIAAYCAVDIFALISGYVGYTDKPKPFRSRKVLSFWMQVFCYSFGITVCAFLVRPDAGNPLTIVYTAFPISTQQYWFASSYMGLLLLSSWINRFIRSLSEKDLSKFCMMIFILFSCYNTLFGKLIFRDPFSFGNGYSMIWLIVLYIIGAWMKRCRICEKINKSITWIVGLSSVLLTFCVTMLARDRITDYLNPDFLVDYLSTTVLLAAMALVILFAKVNLKGTFVKAVAFLSPAAFGVYLIHVHPKIWDFFMKDAFVWIAESSAWLIPLEVIGCSLAILIVCLFIEKVRLFLFDFMKINRLLSLLGDKIDDVLNKLAKRIDNSRLIN